MSGTRPSLAWTAFLVIAFGIVGLTGLFATVATPLPLERALLRDAALDEALQAPDAAAAVAALRDRLGESAEAIAHGRGDFGTRIQVERAAMRDRFLAEADATASRLRLLITIVTLAAAGFGAVIVNGLARGK
jgi:hypothetical protein